MLRSMNKFVLYGRVSTEEQGRTGYSLDAQIDAGHRLANGGEVVSVYREVESGSNNDRPLLRQAIADCRRYQARLIVTKLDRLARNLRYLLQVIDDELNHIPLMGDLPHIGNDAAGRFTLQVMAAAAEFEVNRGRDRTKEGMAKAKANGVHCGRAKAPEAARRLAQQLAQSGLSLRRIATRLASAGHLSPSGQPYSHTSVQHMIQVAA